LDLVTKYQYESQNIDLEVEMPKRVPNQFPSIEEQNEVSKSISKKLEKIDILKKEMKILYDNKNNEIENIYFNF
jgi:hypothetical protein